MARQTWNVVASQTLFTSVPRDVSNRALRLLTVIDVPEGAVLARQGQIGREFLLLLEGTVAVAVDGAPIAVVSRGGHFGELALLERHENPCRRAGFHTLGPCRLAVANRREFTALRRLSPVIDQRLQAGAKRRRDYLDALDRPSLVGTAPHRRN